MKLKIHSYRFMNQHTQGRNIYQVILFLPSGDISNIQTVKTEEPSLVEACIFDGQMKSMSAERTECSAQPSKRQEDTPMEVSSNPPSTDVFKVYKR